ncbi:uncharacterized protein METZ01_LOCUS213242 [marine metagenome]|uniref:Uncharacterized protein n=1 Tax=marine metagenome TaxID=408172 RepID=A0A382FBC5_9ZZZZ
MFPAWDFFARFRIVCGLLDLRWKGKRLKRFSGIRIRLEKAYARAARYHKYGIIPMAEITAIFVIFFFP